MGSLKPLIPPATADVLGEKDDVATVPSDVTSVVSIVKEIYNEVATIAQGTSLFAKSAPDTMEIDDSGTYSLELYDIGDAIPVSAEITAGNYQIDRVRNGALTNIVASTGASKGDGRIYASEDFTAAAGWAVGDIVLVTFSGGSILTGGVTTTLPNAYFYTRITRGESIETKVDTVLTRSVTNVSMIEFWSDVDDIVTLTTATIDVDLPNVIIADVPTNTTIVRVVGMIKMRAMNNTNVATNAINGAALVKVKKSTGAWATDDVDLINIPDNIWSISASTKEGGMLIEGDNDTASEVDENATYNLRFNGNIFVDGNNLELIDLAVGLKVYFISS